MLACGYKFIFSCSTRYLTHSLRSFVRYQVEHPKLKFVSTCRHVISSTLVAVASFTKVGIGKGLKSQLQPLGRGKSLKIVLYTAFPQVIKKKLGGGL